MIEYISPNEDSGDVEGLDNAGKDVDSAGGGESGLGEGLEAFGEEKSLPTLRWGFNGLALILTLPYRLGDKSCCSPSIILMVEISRQLVQPQNVWGQWANGRAQANRK